VVVDLPGAGIHVARDFEPFNAATRPLDPEAAVRIRIARRSLEPILAEVRSASRRHRAVALARLAVSLEILGVCESALALATGHARDREQFGKPIGEFQAVRHILARAQVDLHAIRQAATVVLAASDPLDGDGPALLKALAGRNARLILQASMQVLGAIGFCEEHEQHRFARRALTLDALWGSASRLRVDIAAATLRSGIAWRVPCFDRVPADDRLDSTRTGR
jgi:alkylation response protein AidB-like acyl-CoA dehydrogenase